MIIRLSLDDTGVSQQMAFISGQSLYQDSEHIFEILQDLTVAVVTHRHTYWLLQPSAYARLIIITLIIISH